MNENIKDSAGRNTNYDNALREKVDCPNCGSRMYKDNSKWGCEGCEYEIPSYA